MGGTYTHVHLDHNSSPYNFFNLMMSEDFRIGILQEYTNTGAEMEGAGRKGVRYRTKYPDLTPFSRDEIDIYLGLVLANGINMKPQINSWLLQTHNSTIDIDNNVSKLFPRGRRRWDEFKRFFCMYDPHTYPKYNAVKHSLFKVRRAL